MFSVRYVTNCGLPSEVTVSVSLQIVRQDRTMEEIVFPVPNICEFLTSESKLRVYYTTERDEQGSKINDFFLRAEDLFNEMNWQKKLRGEFVFCACVHACEQQSIKMLPWLFWRRATTGGEGESLCTKTGTETCGNMPLLFPNGKYNFRAFFFLGILCFMDSWKFLCVIRMLCWVFYFLFSTNMQVMWKGKLQLSRSYKCVFLCVFKW